jgi:hypothetical protein
MSMILQRPKQIICVKKHKIPKEFSISASPKKCKAIKINDKISRLSNNLDFLPYSICSNDRIIDQYNPNVNESIRRR